MDTLLHFSKQL